MGWSSLLEDIIDRLNSELFQISSNDPLGGKLKTSDQLDGIKTTCERLLRDLKKHLSLTTNESLDLADTIIKLEQEKKGLLKTANTLNQTLEEKQKLLIRKAKEAADQLKRNEKLEAEYHSYKTQTKRSLNELKAQNRTFEREIVLLVRENRELRAKCDSLSREAKAGKRVSDKMFRQSTHSDKNHPPQARTESDIPRSSQQSPQFKVHLLRPISADPQSPPIVEARTPVVSQSKALNDSPQSQNTHYSKRGKKIRVFDLAKELKLDNKRIMEDAEQEGINVNVPSNTLPVDVANRIRAKYRPKSHK
jgi:hypothetical protein